MFVHFMEINGKRKSFCSFFNWRKFLEVLTSKPYWPIHMTYSSNNWSRNFQQFCETISYRAYRKMERRLAERNSRRSTVPLICSLSNFSGWTFYHYELRRRSVEQRQSKAKQIFIWSTFLWSIKTYCEQKIIYRELSRIIKHDNGPYSDRTKCLTQ